MIGQKITQACKLKGITLRAACQAAGLKYSTLHAQVSHERAIPFATVDKLARTLNLPLSYFSEHNPIFQFAPDAPGTLPNQMMLTLERAFNAKTKEMANIGVNISIDDVLDWLVHVDFQLKDFDWLKDSVDLYYPLEEGEVMAKAHSVGEKSLARQLFGYEKDIAPEIYFKKFDPDDLKHIRLSHAEIVPHKYTITDQTIDVTLNGTRIAGSYRKLMAGVTDDKGSPFTLVFCRLVRFSKI